MIILAVETSCDDTSISVLKFKKNQSKNLKFEILSNIVSSQVEIHKKYGGIYPTLARREHQKNLPILLKKALKNKPDYLAVTVGPGLEPCLWTGINFTKSLSKKWNLPIIPVNHIEAHILANWLEPSQMPKKIFPAISLIVSGGHTQLILMKDIGRYKMLGETRDDAAGECFDKAARILGLGYPGGPAIADLAAKTNKSSQIKLPRPMLYSKDYDFSFSGLKTAVLYRTRQEKLRTAKFKQAMATEIQQAIIDVLIKKTINAAKNYKVKTIIMGGGVTANKELRKQMKKATEPAFNLYLPSLKFCTDNAAMIGITAYFHQKKAVKRNISAKANLKL